LIAAIAANANIARHIHLPLQSGSNRILGLMNRRYTIEKYFERINAIRDLVPDCAITTDIIAGFPGETLADHEQTLEAMKKIRFDGAFMFRYSPRRGTAACKMADDVPEEEKIRRLNEIIALQQEFQNKTNKLSVGKSRGDNRRVPQQANPDQWMGPCIEQQSRDFR
jgi:tRNA-2-methylthio-N6-dimethylallyladenosine synthase